MSDIYQKCITRLIDEYTAGDFYREVCEAKKEFFENIGGINEDDPDFENQMDLFMGWYLFGRPLNNFDLPPVHLFHRKNSLDLSADELVLFKNLTATVHSVFELLKLRDDQFQIRDLSSREKVDVSGFGMRFGFSKGDIFEARLIPYEKSYCFASGFCFHPREASKFIEDQMKKIRQQDLAQRTKLMLKLNNMRYKHMRFPHIDVSYIYTLTPKF